MPRFIFTLWLLFTFSLPAHSAVEESLGLLTYARPYYQELNLSQDDWRWLRWKHELVLGTAQPDYPPFEMSNNTHDLEGITADYISIIGNSLNVRISVRRYANRTEVLDALAKGEIDLLSSLELPEGHADLLLSKSYVTNRPTLVSRIGHIPPLNESLKGKRLAISESYIHKATAHNLYPQATIQTYSSHESAFSAVAFGQADVLLSDVISAQYLISKTYSNYVKITHIGEPATSGFGFAVHKDNARLQRLLNVALNAIPEGQDQSILRRWGDMWMLSLEKVELSSTEQLWIKQHPTVTIAVNRYLAPLSYFDVNGNYLGVTSELLSMLTAKTGLEFKVEAFPSDKEMYAAIHQNRVQVVAGTAPAQERDYLLRFTRPYLFSPFVLITRDEPEQSQNLDAMAGKTLSISAGHSLIPFLRENYPQVRILAVKSNQEALALLKKGKSDATILSATLANYSLPRITEDKLKVASSIDPQQALAAFAVRRDQIELYAIMDKTVRNIPPDALKQLISRWQTNAEITPPSWRDYRDIIYPVITGSVTLLVMALAWGAYMRNQSNKRKQVKRMLRYQIRLMEALINGTPHPIYVRDLDRKLLICNDSYLQALNTEREIALGTQIEESLLEEATSFDITYQNILAGGEPLLHDCEIHINGQRSHVYLWTLPFHDDDGEIQGIIGGWMDISEREVLLKELERAKEDAVDASLAKTTFLATMSHEIRTPISAVIGMLELTLKRADKGELDRPSIEVAYHSARGLLDLIGDILDVARIESGRLSLNPERTNLRELIESIIRVFDGLARKKALRLDLDIDSDANCEVLVDSLRLKQILSNLISNAIKFTEQGTISVSILTKLIDRDRLQVEFSIKDTGVGISPEDQQRLFQPFSQIPDSNQHARSGSGLGLVISKTLCEMMGGNLTLESEPGVGTRIFIQLRLNRLEFISTTVTSPVTPSEPGQKQSLHVLVVDDSQANRQLLCEQLKFLDYSVSQAEDGAEGLETWQRETFDVVITDCNMPVVNGYELARNIRNAEQEGGRTRTWIFGYTANTQLDEHQRCEVAGMDGCLFKPMDLAALEYHLSRLLPRPKPTRQCSMPNRFDIEELDHLTGGDPQVMQRVLQGLLESNQKDLAQLKLVLSSDSSRGVLELAHRIKGAARIVKARELIEHCEQLEHACRQTAAFSEIITVLANLEQSMIEFENDLLSQQKLRRV